jgi:hypothetical protein
LNKRTLWGSLWLPSQETIQVCHALLQSPNFFRLLLRIDEELASETHAAGCACGGVLHRANYPRKPRACLREVRGDFESRFSFCCSLCRRRSTSMSVRFLGRRVYLALAVVLGSARHAGQNPAAARLSGTLNVPVLTLRRWRHWWQAQFPQTALWQAACARFMPPVVSDLFPASLLERFSGSAEEALMRLLVFLSPITVKPIDLPEGR